ncbi:hypothetical protein H1C71_042859, partial [Ictidomys tridecemlineatus]
HEPQLQTVYTAATLHHLVTRVQSHMVELVLREEVAGLESMAAPEQVRGILEKSRALQSCSEELVGVPGHGVSHPRATTVRDAGTHRQLHPPGQRLPTRWCQMWH